MRNEKQGSREKECSADFGLGILECGIRRSECRVTEKIDAAWMLLLEVSHFTLHFSLCTLHCILA